MRKKLMSQIDAIRKSFRMNPEEEIIYELTSDRNLTSEKLDHLVSVLDFYQRNAQIDHPKLERYSRYFLQQFSQFANHANRRVEELFHSIAEEASKFDFIINEAP